MREVLRPQGQGDSSMGSPCSDKRGEATCKPSCASHSAASNFPDLPITCSNTGTRKAHHRLSRSASVILGSSGRDTIMTACVSEGIPSRARAFICSRVPATAAGAKAAASTLQPCGKTRTGRLVRALSLNQGTSTAVRGAGWTGYTNGSFRPLRNKTPVTTRSSVQAAIILSRFSLKMARASARLTPNSYSALL